MLLKSSKYNHHGVLNLMCSVERWDSAWDSFRIQRLFTKKQTASDAQTCRRRSLQWHAMASVCTAGTAAT